MKNRQTTPELFMPLAVQHPKILVAIKQICSAKSKRSDYLTAAAFLLATVSKQIGGVTRASLIVSTARAARELEHVGKEYMPEQDFWLKIYKARCACRLNEFVKGPRKSKPTEGENDLSR